MPFSRAKWTHPNAAHMANAKAMWSSRLGNRTTIVLSQTQISRRYEWIHMTKANIYALYTWTAAAKHRKNSTLQQASISHPDFFRNITQPKLASGHAIWPATLLHVSAYFGGANLPWVSLVRRMFYCRIIYPAVSLTTKSERIWEKWFCMLSMSEIQEGANKDVQCHMAGTKLTDVWFLRTQKKLPNAQSHGYPSPRREISPVKLKYKIWIFKPIMFRSLSSWLVSWCFFLMYSWGFWLM